MRLIDADELLEHVWRERLDSRERIARLVETRPTIVPKRKRGGWLYASHYGERYRICSVCFVERLDDFPTGMNYCPNCGADMRGE